MTADASPPIAAPTRVPAPEFMSAKARKMWAQAAPPLMAHGLLTDKDAIGFARYCEWLAEYMAVQKARSRSKGFVKKQDSRYAKGVDRVDKRFQVLLLIDKNLRDYEDRYGMNPRERLAIMAKLAAGAGHHTLPPAAPAGTEQPGAPDGPVLTPSAPTSPVGFLGTTRH